MCCKGVFRQDWEVEVECKGEYLAVELILGSRSKNGGDGGYASSS